MPRPKPQRQLQSEQNVAAWVRHERERRGWSYAGLAQRMTDAGCAIDASAIYKIEKSDPPRRITVDELVGFAAAFGRKKVDDLLVPVELAADARARELVEELRRVVLREQQLFGEIIQHLEEYPAVEPVVNDLVHQDDVLRMAVMGAGWAGLVKMQQRYRAASPEDKAKMHEAFFAAGAAVAKEAGITVASENTPKRKVQSRGKRRKKT